MQVQEDIEPEAVARCRARTSLEQERKGLCSVSCRLLTVEVLSTVREAHAGSRTQWIAAICQPVHAVCKDCQRHKTRLSPSYGACTGMAQLAYERTSARTASLCTEHHASFAGTGVLCQLCGAHACKLRERACARRHLWCGVAGLNELTTVLLGRALSSVAYATS